MCLHLLPFSLPFHFQVASAEGRTFISSLVRSRRTVPTVDLFTRFLEGRYSDEQFQFFLFLRTGAFIVHVVPVVFHTCELRMLQP